jgi:hypothetical protein
MKKPELTFEEFCELPLIYTRGMRFDWGAKRMYRNEEIGLQVEVVTKQKVWGDIYSGWQPEKQVYFLDDDDRQFDTVVEAYVAYMEKVCGVKEEA